MHKTLCLCGLLLFSCLVMVAQQPGKAALEKQRAAIQKDLDNIKRSLNETKQNKKVSLAQLQAVQQKLELRQKEINVINQQMNVIDGNISNRWKDVAKLKSELDTLKLQYDKSVVYSYKTRSDYDLLNFIFSADNFNDALKRISYLRSFRAYREEQALIIAHTQDLLHQKIAGLNESRLEKRVALKEDANSKKKLEEEKKEKDEVLNKLRLRENILTKEIADKKRQDLKISSAIVFAINKAKAADLLAAKHHAATINKSTTAKETKSLNTRKFIPAETNSAAIFSTKRFENNYHMLLWPVESGKISMHFGPQVIPPNIHIDNKFLTFETEVGAPVKAIFEGEVTLVTNIAGTLAVMIRNGNYITTYSNLSLASVSQGQQIKTGQLLGKAAQAKNNIGELELGISNIDNKYFDPEKWLR